MCAGIKRVPWMSLNGSSILNGFYWALFPNKETSFFQRHKLKDCLVCCMECNVISVTLSEMCFSLVLLIINCSSCLNEFCLENPFNKFYIKVLRFPPMLENAVGETHPLSWGSRAAILTRPTRWALDWNILMTEYRTKLKQKKQVKWIFSEAFSTTFISVSASDKYSTDN